MGCSYYLHCIFVLLETINANTSKHQTARELKWHEHIYNYLTFNKGKKRGWRIEHKMHHFTDMHKCIYITRTCANTKTTQCNKVLKQEMTGDIYIANYQANKLSDTCHGSAHRSPM